MGPTKRVGFVLNNNVEEDRASTARRPEDGAHLASYQETDRADLAGQLRDMLKREDLPASARVTAARTLAEIEGLIGRHQAAPERGTTAPLSSLSRDQLHDELSRLRTLFDLGLVS